MLPPVGIEVAAAADAAECTSWAECPVVTEFHPVAWDYGVRYQTLLAAAMSGPGAKQAFGTTIGQANLRWRLYDADGIGLPRDADTATEWRDTSTAGALLAMNAVLDETLARAPALQTMRTVVDAVISPSFNATPATDETPARFEHRVGSRLQQQIAMRAQEQGFLERKPKPDFGLGVGWQLKDAEAPESAPLLTYGGWLQLTRIGLTSVRAEWSFATGHWLVLAGEQVWPDVTLTASLRSQDRSLEPARWAAGVLWNLPGNNGWTARLDRSTIFSDDEVIWTLSLRSELGTPIPGRLHPPLAPWPSVPEREPLTTDFVAISPADETPVERRKPR